MNTKTMKFAGVEYDNNGEILVVNENTAALAIYIPLDKIPGVDTGIFEEEFVQDKNTNSVSTPLPPDPPHAEAATILPKLEQATKPKINTGEVVAEDTADADDSEDISPEKASLMTGTKTRRMKKKKIYRSSITVRREDTELNANEIAKP